MPEYSIGECLYGEYDETENTLTQSRGYLIVGPAGEHVAIIPGADEEWSTVTAGASVARKLVAFLNGE